MQREPDFIFERQTGGLFLPRSRSAPPSIRKASANQPLELLVLEDRVLYSAAPVDLPDAAPNEPSEPNTLEQQVNDLTHWSSLLAAADLVEQGATSETIEPIGQSASEAHGTILIVVDQGIADYQTLVDDIRNQLPQQHSLLLIDSTGDGWLQLNQYLSQHQGIQQVHLFSHAASGQVLLGNQSLQIDDLFNDDSAAIWQRALHPDADVFLYGCQLAADSVGEQFVSQFAIFSGADVAASLDQTGNASGADWDLEFSIGLLNSDSLFSNDHPLHWEGTLDPQTFSRSGIQELSGLDRGSTSAVAVNANGSYVIVWSEQVSGNGWDVLACRFNADGTTNGSVFTVNQSTGGDQRYASVDMDSSGRFIITWTGIDIGNDGILARLYAANGTALTNEFVVNTYKPSAQFNSSVSMAQDGRFVIAWEGNGSEDNQGIYAQRYDANANALGSQIFVNGSATGLQENPTVSMNSSGAFVVAWNDETTFRYQRFDSNGNKLDQNGFAAAEMTVSAIGTARRGDVLLNHDGTVVSTWQEYSGGFWDVYFQKDDVNGSALISKSLIITNDTTDQLAPSIDGSGSGEFIITWEGRETGDLDGGVFYRLYNSTGLATPYTFLANGNNTTSHQGLASVAATSLENYVVVWSGNSATDTSDLGHNNVSNAIPIGVNDSTSVTEAGGYGNANLGSLLPVNVLLNDSDTADTLTVVGIVQGTGGVSTSNVGSPVAGLYGTLTLQADGTLSYSLNELNSSVQALRTSANTLTENYTYTVRDSGNMVATATITITITGQNDAPTAIADSATAVEAGGVNNGTAGTNPTGNVLTNDTDPDSGDTKTVTGVAAGAIPLATGNVGAPVTGTYGTINISSTGAYTYTVDNNNPAVQALRTSSNTLTDTFTYTMSDTAGLTSTVQITVTIQGANDTPTVNSLSPPSLAENSANGTVVTTAAATEVDSGDTVTFSLINNAGGRFAINSSTGVITVADGSQLNYEAATSHNITIRATDSGGAFNDRNLTINLTDVNEFPLSALSDNNAAANTIGENAANGATVGITARATDGDSLAVVTYSLLDNAGGRFAINSSTGVITKAGSLDFETANSHTITVQASSSDGGTSTANFMIAVTDFNEFTPTVPVDNDATINEVVENSLAGTLVGITAYSFDGDGSNNTITYSLTDSAAGRFAIGSSTGVVTLTSLSVNYEQATSHNITVRATSSDGTFTSQVFTINVLNGGNEINEITDANSTPDTLTEDASLGSSVITASCSHPDLLAITYSLTNDGGGKFAIDSSTGIVTLVSSLNYESATSHLITVRAEAGDGSFATHSFTITVQDIDEFDVGAVTDNNGATNTIAENAANGATVGLTARATDADGSNNTITYSLDNNAGGRFAINSSTGVVTVANGLLLDFETATSHTVTVRATSSDTSFSTALFTINVTNVNEAPTISSGATYILSPTTEDSISGGNLASDILTGVNWADVDASALSGLAITGVTGSGTWQFSTDGASWTNFGSVSGTNALLITSTTQVRYSPNTQNAETGTFTFKAWDRTTGTASTNGTARYASTASSGGSTAYSTNNATASISVTAVNDAPTITNGSTFTLTSTNEDSPSSGTLASSILSGVSWADVDTGAVNGLAITAVSGSGDWQYSTDGVTWASFGSVSSTNALLINSSTRVRYTPNTQNTETATFIFKAWDQTSGTASTNSIASYLSVASSGGTTAFSTSNATASMSVTAVNDAPTITNSATHTLTSTTEDTTSSGTLASAILAGVNWSDVDTGALSGLAITGVTGSGTWQYSTNGTTWRDFGAVSSTNALLITSSTQVRYTPNTQNSENATFTFKAWDQTSGTASTNATASYATTASSGDTTAFSTNNATAFMNVTAVNDAPTITNAASYSFTSVNEDTTSAGVLASTILNSASWADVDSGALSGMAITAVTGNGTWQYSTDGSTWANFGAVSSTNSLLLSSTTQIRYIPAQNGETATFTYKAWDQTSGTASTNSIQNYASTTTPGGTTAFSINNASGQIVVTSVNDAPTVTNASSYSFTSVNEDTTSAGVLASSILTSAGWADLDTGALSGMAITGVTGAGTWQYSTDGVTWAAFGSVSSTNALLITSSTQIRYIPNGQNGETATFSYKAWDQTSGTASTNAMASYATTASSGGTTAFSASNATGSIVVTSVNDAPTITNASSYSFTSVNEDTTSAGILASTILTSASWADVDTGALSGMAITGVTGAGTWQYSTDGTTWASFGAVSSTNALLVTSSTQIRYIPAQNGETATFTYKAWDQTSGTASTNATPSYATTASSGGTTAFSASNATGQIVVTSVNDAPTITNASSYSFTSVNEDTTSAGVLASTILTSASRADVDTGALSGMAITGVTGAGTWQYSTDGSTWANFGAVSSTNALLISSTSQIRYIPNSQNGETATFTYKAWDQTSGTASTNATASYATTASSGGTTAFSASNATGSIVVTSVNDAPTITNGGSFTLASTNEDTASSGTLASTILSGVSWADVDIGALSGMAITDVTGSGIWQFSTDGATWANFGAVSSTNALLITSGTQVRYTPNTPNAETATFTFKAWDQTSGAASTNATPSYATTASSGGTTAFSTSNASASISVTAVNDSPTAVSDSATAVEAGGVHNAIAGSNPSGNVLTNDTDPDAGDSKTVTGVATGVLPTASGNVGNAVLGNYGSITIAANGAYTYTVDNSNPAVEALRTSGNTLTDTFTYTTTDGAGLSSTTQLTVTIQGANDAPHDLATAGLTIAENSSNGASVGTITRSDVDSGDNAIYSLVDSAGGRFAINSSTGVVTVANSLLLDREAAASHNITVRVTDTAGAIYDEVMTVTITDVDEFDVGVVADSNIATNSIAENTANGTTVGITANASDADATNNGIIYSLDESAGGRFSINSSTGVVTVANGALLNYESAANHSIIIRATSADGSSSTQSFTINLTDVDEFDVGPVTDSNAAANSVAENAANGTAAGITAIASDADGTNNFITYSLDDSAGGRFAINSSTGVVTVANGALLNYESATSHNITIRATSADGSFSTQSFTINLSDVDEFDVSTVSDSNLAANSVVENAANGTAVGVTASASDADGTTNVIAYSLDDSAGGRFAINSSTGVVTVANGALLNYESATSHNITIRATSADGSFSTQSFTINLSDVDEFGIGPVSDSNLAANSVAENAANGTAVGVTASASDADGTTNAITYSLDDSAGGRFAINSSTGVVTVANGALLNYESATSHIITIRATSADGSFSTQSFTINLSDVDEFDIGTVSDSNLAANSVAENAGNGTAVGVTASASDADGTTNVISYSLDDSAGGRFTINSSTGVVTVANGAILNYEAATSHNIIIRATSADGSSSIQSFTINLTDVDEFDVGPVTDSNAAANSVAENAINGTAVGITAIASDADATTNVITYSLDDSAGGRFAINSSTGAVSVANSSLLNHEAASSHTIVVRATSADGSSSTQSFNINLTDVDEFDVGAIQDLNPAVNNVIENSANGTAVGITAWASDPDATTNAIAYSLDDDAGGRFSINASTGVVTVANGSLLNFEAANSHAITIRATSADGSFSTQSLTINLLNQNEGPTAVNDNPVAVEAGGVSNGASGTNPTGNVLTNDTDPDGGDTLTVVGVAAGMPANAAGQVGLTIAGQYGSIRVNADGTYLYNLDNSNPAVQALRTTSDTLTDTFTYTMTDLAGIQSTARISILVTGANDDPTAQWSESGLAINSGSSNNQYVQLQDFDDLIGGRSQFTLRVSISTTQSNFFLLSYATSNHHNEFRIYAYEGTLRLSFRGNDWNTDVSSNLVTDGNRHELAVIRDASLGQIKLFIDGNLVAANSSISPGNNLQTNGLAILAEEQDEVSGDFDSSQFFRGTLWDLSVYDTAWSNSRVANEFGVVSSSASDLKGYWNFNQISSNQVTDQIANRHGSLHTITGSGWVAGTPAIVRADWIKSVNEHSANGLTIAILDASDLDAGDTITWSLSNDAGGRFAINSSTGEVTIVDSSLVDRETAASFQITAVATDLAGSTQTRTYTIQLNDVDEFDVSPIVDGDNTLNQVAENSGNGTLVGLTAQAFDADATNNTITFSLTDSAAGRFAINSSTGVVSVANSSLLNRESGASHTITVRATSADGSISTQSFTINVTDVDEFDVSLISDLNPAVNSVNENAANGSTVGITAAASDADSTNNSVTYSLDNSAGGRFTIDPVTGVVTVADSSLLDREAASSHTITIRATSQDGSFTTQSYLIGLNDVDEFDVTTPADTNTAANLVNEGAANGTTVGITATASDMDATNNAVTWTLDDDAGGRFAINSSTGVVTVANGALLDRELSPSHSITVRATSADGSVAVSTFLIQVGNVNESPIAVPDTAIAIEAGGLNNSSPGLNPTGNVLLNDGDIDSDDTRIVVGVQTGVQSSTAGSVGIPISGLYGSLTLNADGTYTYTVDNSNPQVEALRSSGVQLVDTFSYTIRDAAGLESTTRLDVSVLGANDTPNSMWAETGLMLNAGSSNNQYLQITNFGNLISGDEFTLRLSFTTSYTNPFFLSYASSSPYHNDLVICNELHKLTIYIGGQAWRTTIDTSLLTDGERHEIALARTAADGGLKVFVDGNLKDSITGLMTDYQIGSAGTLVLGQEQDTVGGSFVASQIFRGTYWDFSVHSTAWSNGRVQLNTGHTFHDLPDLRGHWDFELTGGDTVFDQIGTKHASLMSIPAGGAWVSGAAAQVQADWKPNLIENAANGTVVSNLRAADIDQGEQLTWSLVDNAGGRFQIDASTGQVTVADSTGLNFEHLQTHQIIVRVTDDGGLSREETYQIRLTDVQESDVSIPVDDNPAANFVLENSIDGAQVGLSAWSIDQDGTTNRVSYSLDDNAGGRFAINSSTGVVTVANGSLLDREAAANHSIVVRATSEDGTTAIREFTIAVGDVSEFPIGPISDLNTSNNLLPENASTGTLAGITAQASDPDATNNTVRYSLDDSGDGRFVIDEITGVVSVAGDGLFDYESVSTVSIIVRASSADGSFVTQSFAINLIDIDEFDTGPISDFDTTDNLVYENSEIGTYAGLTAFARDADATNNGITYRLLDDDGGRFSIDSSTGRVLTKAPLDFEVDGQFRTIQVTAESEDGSSTIRSFTVEIADVYKEAFATYAGLDVEFSPTEILTSSRDENYEITNLTLENTPAFGDLIVVSSTGSRIVSSRDLSSLLISSNERLRFIAPATTQGNITLGYTAMNGAGRERTGTVTILVEAAAPPAPPSSTTSFTSSDSGSTSSSERAPSSNSPSEKSVVVQPEATATSSGGGEASGAAGGGAVMAVGPIAGSGGTPGANFEFAEEAEASDSKADTGAGKSSGDPSQQADETRGESGVFTSIANLMQSSGAESLVASADSGVVTRVFATAAAIEQKLTNSTQFTEYLSKLETALEQTPVVVGFEMPAYASAGASLFTVGYVAWLIRGGVLLTSFMSSLPSWQSFDPLPILENAGSSGDDAADGSDSSIAELVDSEQPVPSMSGTAG